MKGATMTSGIRANRKAGLGAAALATVGVVAMTACGAGDGAGRERASAESGTTAASATESTRASAAGEANTPATEGATTPAAKGTGTGTATTSAGGGSPKAARPGMGSDCTTDDLKAALKPTGQEMNSKYFDLTLTNTTGGTCALKGYPGLSVTNGTGERIGKPATRSNNGDVQDVVLKAGQTAHAVVQTPDRGVTDGKCWAKPSRVKVYPPDNTASLSTAAPSTLEVCGDSFTVGPFTARAL